MDTEERIQVMEAFYNPRLSTVACVAKCVAGIAIIGLIGVIGITFNESGKERFADSAHVKAAQVRASEAPRRHESVKRQELQQARIEAAQRNP